MNDNKKSSLLDVISGNESLKIDISIDIVSIILLILAILVSGTMLIYISRQIK